MDISQLTTLGLSETEANIYIALIESGPASILELARRTRINRSTIYYLLQSLKEKQLIAQTVQGKRNLLMALDPSNLKVLLEKKIVNTLPLIDELKAMAKVGKTKPIIALYEGLPGLKKVFEQAATSNEKTMYGLVGLESLTTTSKALLHYWLGPYTELRKKKGVIAKLVVPDTEQGVAFKKLDSEKFRETRLVPSSAYNFDSEFLVHDDMVDLFVFTAEEQFAVSIKSAAIANTMKMVWRLVWNQAY